MKMTDKNGGIKGRVEEEGQWRRVWQLWKKMDEERSG